MTPAATVRGVISALACAFVALVALLGLLFVVLGDAGPDWNAAASSAMRTVALLAIGALAAGLGAAIGAWQAALGGAQSASAAVLAGAAGPTAVAVIGGVALATPSAAGIFAAATEALVVTGGAFAGAALIGRRLE
jgi:hypothetical protein